MARNRKGPPHQAKHFQPEDHAHAAHQEQAAPGHADAPGHGVEPVKTPPAGKTHRPIEHAPKGPRRGQ
jgi:hypothetical protein